MFRFKGVGSSWRCLPLTFPNFRNLNTYVLNKGASQSCKLPTASKFEAIQTRTRKARVLRQSAQADIVCVAAISFSTGTFCKNGMLPLIKASDCQNFT